MGYSHYFELHKAPSKEQKEEFLSGVRKIIAASGVNIVNGMGDELTVPYIDQDGISLNGCEDDAHETLMIDFNDLSWSFCKTNMKPYDKVVVAILILAETILDFEWSSDGCDDDFIDGKELLNQI